MVGIVKIGSGRFKIFKILDYWVEKGLKWDLKGKLRLDVFVFCKLC